MQPAAGSNKPRTLGKTAEQLTDHEAKEVMAQLGQMYFLLAQTALIQVTGLESSHFVTQLGMLQRCNSVATSGGVRPSNAKVH